MKWELAVSRYRPQEFPLHKVFPGPFQVDDALFRAQAFGAERKVCGCRSCSLKRPIRDGADAPFKSRSIRWRPDILAQEMPRETRLESRQVKPANREVPEWKKPHRIVSRASPDAEPGPGLKTRTSAYNPNGTMGASP